MKFTSPLSTVVIALLAATATPSGAAVVFDSVRGDYSVSYELALGYLPTSGGDILNTFIFVWDGAGNFNVDSGYQIPGRTTTTLSQQLSFAPTSALLIGYTLGVAGVGDGKDHIFTFTNDSFANSAYGNKWADVFPGASPTTRTSHSTMVSLLVDASQGNSLALGNLTNFVRGEGAAAAFNPAATPSAIEWSIAVPEPSAASLAGLAACGVALRRRRALSRLGGF